MKVPKNKTGENNPNTRVVNTEDADLNSLNIPENDVVEKEEATKRKKKLAIKGMNRNSTYQGMTMIRKMN